MPSYRGHLVGGSVAFIITCILIGKTGAPLINLMEWFFCALMGSLFPDIDTKSKGQLFFYRIMVVIICLLSLQKRFMLAAGISIIGMIPMIVKHRGIFHSYLFTTFLIAMIGVCVFIYLPAQFQKISIDLLFFSVGLYSHLLLDFQLARPKKFFRS